MLYCLHFRAYILQCLFMLFKIFEVKFGDISSVGYVNRTAITQIIMLFLYEHTNLNVVIFNEDA